MKRVEAKTKKQKKCGNIYLSSYVHYRFGLKGVWFKIQSHSKVVDNTQSWPK